MKIGWLLIVLLDRSVFMLLDAQAQVAARVYVDCDWNGCSKIRYPLGDWNLLLRALLVLLLVFTRSTHDRKLSCR